MRGGRDKGRKGERRKMMLTVEWDDTWEMIDEGGGGGSGME